jgi:hypothetical protein
MRNLHSLIHSKEHLFTHVQGQAFKLFKDRCLTVAMDRTMLLIDKLEALLEHLLRWDGEWNGVSMVSPEGFKKTLVRKCQIYRYTLASKLFVPEVFEVTIRCFLSPSAFYIRNQSLSVSCLFRTNMVFNLRLSTIQKYWMIYIGF